MIKGALAAGGTLHSRLFPFPAPTQKYSIIREQITRSQRVGKVPRARGMAAWPHCRCVTRTVSAPIGNAPRRTAPERTANSQLTALSCKANINISPAGGRWAGLRCGRPPPPPPPALCHSASNLTFTMVQLLAIRKVAGRVVRTAAPDAPADGYRRR